MYVCMCVSTQLLTVSMAKHTSSYPYVRLIFALDHSSLEECACTLLDVHVENDCRFFFNLNKESF